MALGRVELIVIGFPGTELSAEVRSQIEALVAADVVSVADALFVSKDVDGNTVFYELHESAGGGEDLKLLSSLISDEFDLLSDEDMLAFATELAPGSSALALVFEHTWMRPVRDAVAAAGGFLIADFPVPAAVIDEVLAAAQEA